MINFKEITEDNLFKIVGLKVHKEQEDQVADNIYSILQGNYRKTAWFKAIYFGETPVGFIMLDFPADNKELCYVWRFMIDKKHQGKGYGKTALLKAMDYAKTFPDIKIIKLSYVPKEKDGADAFYKKLGFVETGEVDGDEVVMKFTV